MSNRNGKLQSRTTNSLKSHQIIFSNRKFLMVFIECGGSPPSPEAHASGIHAQQPSHRSSALSGSEHEPPLGPAFKRVLYFPAISPGSMQKRKVLIEHEN
jgi:hypothetical protein